MRKSRFILSVLCFFAAVGLIRAQTPSHFDQHKAFDPIFYPSLGTVYRSATGEPGPKYWSNRADYTINTTLDTTKHELSGSVTITYTNNSPDTLKELVFKLYPNFYKKGVMRNYKLDAVDMNDGVQIKKLSIRLRI